MAKHLSKSFEEIEDMSDLRESFIRPTRREWLQFLFVKNRPSWDEAWYWSNVRMSGGQMTPPEFADYVEAVGYEQARSIHRSRCLTTPGWFLYLTFKYIRGIFTYSYEEYCNNVFDNLWEEWDYYRFGDEYKLNEADYECGAW